MYEIDHIYGLKRVLLRDPRPLIKALWWDPGIKMSGYSRIHVAFDNYLKTLLHLKNVVVHIMLWTANLNVLGPDISFKKDLKL